MSDNTREIVIDVKRLRMRDYALIERKENISIIEMIPLMARISNFTEDELLDLELDEFTIIQNKLIDAIGDIVKKANAGN